MRNMVVHLILGMVCYSHQALIPAATLKSYIAFARARCQPELSPDAATDLIQGYCDMRRMGTSRKARLPRTRRCCK